jgi:putative peptide zinc metalloprotease protein
VSVITQQLMTGLRQKFRGKLAHHVVALTAAAALTTALTGACRPDDGTDYSVQPPGSTAFAAVATHSPSAPAWAFPFDPPDEPEEDGNQALAVNTTDGSAAYSVEFSLVWAEDGDPVDTKNEAYAFAHCTGCAAVAVGFQVVLVEERAEIIAPQNHSAAVNYNCLECHTNALANQLVLSVGCGLSDDRMDQLSALWDEIDAYGRNLEYSTNLQDVPLSEIQSRLEAYKQRIIAIVQADPDATPAPAVEQQPAATSA